MLHLSQNFKIYKDENQRFHFPYQLSSSLLYSLANVDCYAIRINVFCNYVIIPSY